MDEKKIKKAFADVGIDKTITCPQAFAIAGEHKIPKMDLVAYCNAHGIKIRGCQLGCFK
jgi:hypothetical protein